MKKSKKEKALTVIHYAPKDADIEKQGIKSPKALLKTKEKNAIIEKYKIRTQKFLKKKNINAGDVEKYLEKRRGKGGSRMISALNQPIPKNKLKAFTNINEAYEIDLSKAIKDGAVKDIHIVCEKPGSIRKINKKDVMKEVHDINVDWKNKKKTKNLIFSDKPHIFLTLKSGKLSKKYIKKL